MYKLKKKHHLAIINLFQLATIQEKPTSSNTYHTMENKFFFNYKNILSINSYSF